MDVHSKKQRSFNMSRIKSSNTKTEISFRKYLWSQGIRGYRLHSRITGKPDLYFPKKKLAVFIDGCFWHKCKKCFVKPKTNVKFWTEKINSNIKRDLKVNKKLKSENIKILRLWEHEVDNDPGNCYRQIIDIPKY